MTYAPPTAPRGQPYGARKQQIDAQKVVPLPNNTPAAPGGATPPPGPPVQRPNVFAPTQRPNEPVTAGAAMGPGPTSFEQMLPDTSGTDVLRALVMQGLDPDGTIRRMLERAGG
jgi:hypothetical protein